MKVFTTLLITFMCFCAGTASVNAAARPQRVKTSSAPADALAAAPAPAILSIIPSQAEPGVKVMMFGSALGAQASVYLGSVEIPARVLEGKQVEFSIPQQLEPGIYALFLKRSDGVFSRPYNFTILPQRPVLNAVSPDEISSCAQGADREVTARGQNFLETSQLVFDGAVLKSRFLSTEALSFIVPQVPGGLHQVVVRNSPDNASVALGLMIDTKPEINQVMIGSQYVNYYELIIVGKNFQQNSSIYVDGQKIGGQGGQDLAEREKLIYSDCTKLVYQRHPYSPVDKDFRIMVMNPGGETSQTINVTAP
ncbi:MAG: IPT/TIG domain-containing protein [Desulfobacteraceae bacterium]|nr:IPT/TIG domain-containing protein [Desulfobacteraceae bacterium]